MFGLFLKCAVMKNNPNLLPPSFMWFGLYSKGSRQFRYLIQFRGGGNTLKQTKHRIAQSLREAKKESQAQS